MTPTGDGQAQFFPTGTAPSGGVVQAGFSGWGLLLAAGLLLPFLFLGRRGKKKTIYRTTTAKRRR
jgi:hypothetical protein